MLGKIHPLLQDYKKKRCYDIVELIDKTFLHRVMAIAHFCHTWCFHLLISWLPTYFGENFPDAKVNPLKNYGSMNLTGILFVGCQLYLMNVYNFYDFIDIIYHLYFSNNRVGFSM